MDRRTDWQNEQRTQAEQAAIGSYLQLVELIKQLDGSVSEHDRLGSRNVPRHVWLHADPHARATLQITRLVAGRHAILDDRRHHAVHVSLLLDYQLLHAGNTRRQLQYNTIQYNIKTYNAPYVTKMLFVGADCKHTHNRFTDIMHVKTSTLRLLARHTITDTVEKGF